MDILLPKHPSLCTLCKRTFHQRYNPILMKDCCHIFCKGCILDYVKFIKNSESFICPFPNCDSNYGNMINYRNHRGDIVSPPWMYYVLPELPDMTGYFNYLVEVKIDRNITREEFDSFLDKELSTEKRKLTEDDKTAIWNIFTDTRYPYKSDWENFKEKYISQIKKTLKNASELWEDPNKFIYGFLNTKTAEDSKFL